MEDLIIKNQKGKKVPLNASQEKDSFVLSKKNDKSPIEKQRKVKVFVINDEKYEEFKRLEDSYELNQSILSQLYNAILNTFKL